jgi:hypothetical protein
MTPGPALTTTNLHGRERLVMAKLDITTEAGKRERSIEEHLENLDRVSKFLNSMANHEEACEEDTVNLSTDTLFYVAAVMDMAVDTLSAELGLGRFADKPEAKVFIRKAQAREGGVS